MKTYSAEEWFDAATMLHDAILQSMENVSDDDLPSALPKNIVMFEFFRLWRGEAFQNVRPALAEKQKEVYAMEDSLGNALMALKGRVKVADEVQAHLNGEWKKIFDLPAQN
jgi:hypothetical protein